jgi:hypothetical protein
MNPINEPMSPKRQSLAPEIAFLIGAIVLIALIWFARDLIDDEPRAAAVQFVSDGNSVAGWPVKMPEER